METKSSATERLRPEVTLGGIVDGLSLPQHELKSDDRAEQKQKVAPVMRQDTNDPCDTSKGEIGMDLQARVEAEAATVVGAPCSILRGGINTGTTTSRPCTYHKFLRKFSRGELCARTGKILARLLRRWVVAF